MSFYSKTLKPPTMAQKVRFESIKQIGCVCCRMLGKGWRYPEINHHLSGGKRISHDHTTGECLWHHKGEPENGMSATQTEAIYGPSRQRSSKRFHAAIADGGFGTDAELLSYQNTLLRSEHGSPSV